VSITGTISRFKWHELDIELNVLPIKRDARLSVLISHSAQINLTKCQLERKLVTTLSHDDLETCILVVMDNPLLSFS
jgi:hypothetical protein